ncbi:MAG TPA: twin-arginine translocation signal domain-containing protein [Thermodesulfobacteriota bacterium]|nr:twin-arginine translocation signal domain-containing protein [Thermodesulfobacteriota bacterium]
MEITRRSFLKYASAVAGITALDQSGLLALRKLTPAEARVM